MFPRVEYGYDVTDLARRGTYLERGMRDAYDKIFSQHQFMTIIYGPDVDYPTDQAALLDVTYDLQASEWSYGLDEATSVRTVSWLQQFLQTDGMCANRSGLEASITCQPDDWYRDFNLWRNPQVFYPVQNDPYFIAGGPLTTSFSFGSLVANTGKQVNSFGFERGPEDYHSNNSLLLSFETVALNMTKLVSTDAKIQMVRDWKTICEASGLDVFMYGYMFTQIEQFIELDFHFWKAVAVSASTIFAISLLLGLSWVGALLVAAFSTLTLVEIYGSLAIFGLQYQSLVAISMLMSLGITVEFIVHPLAAYEFAVGTAEERISEAMRQTAVPVLWGGVSSFLGVLMMAFSDFEYVVKYFFVIYVLIVGLGCFNGLVFLPAVLALFGAPRRDGAGPRAGGQRQDTSSTGVAIGMTYGSNVSSGGDIGGKKKEYSATPHDTSNMI